MNLSAILNLIDLGAIALPEFQRGYVWSRDQVRRLMRSLYLGYPVGSLLTWETQTLNADARGDGPLAPGAVKLLLDGQQRVTSLYGIVRGKPPKFFQGDPNRFLNLYFNLDSEEFEFYGPVKMKDDPRWINVTELMQRRAGTVIAKMMHIPQLTQDIDKLNLYIARLTRLDSIQERVFHLDNVTGEEKTVDVVVEIFNEVNSGGTKLSQGDLALAENLRRLAAGARGDANAIAQVGRRGLLLQAGLVPALHQRHLDRGGGVHGLGQCYSS